MIARIGLVYVTSEMDNIFWFNGIERGRELGKGIFPFFDIRPKGMKK